MRPARLLHRAGARLAAARRGTVAVEFGLIGAVMFALIIGALEGAMYLYIQSAMDFAAYTAARSLATGSGLANAGTEQTFQSVVFCPVLSNVLTCSNVTISLIPVTDFFNGSTANLPVQSTDGFTTGASESLMLLKASYAAPPIGWPFYPGTSTPVMITSTVPFINEY